MAKITTEITTGFIPNPYRQFDVTIPAGSIHKIDYVHNVFEVLANSIQNAVKVDFGGSGGFTDIETGIVYKYPENVSIPFIRLQNTSTEPVNVRLALGVGSFNDQRLNISGTVTVQSTAAAPVYANPARYTACLTTTLTIGAAGTASYSVPSGSKKVLVQNTGSDAVRVFGADGFIVYPGGTFEVNFSGAISFSGTAGQTVTIGSFS